jgi:hypothetical protein
MPQDKKRKKKKNDNARVRAHARSFNQRKKGGMCSRDVLWCRSCVICAPCWRCAGHVRVNTHAVMRTRRSSWLLPSRVALCSWRPAAVGDLHAQLKWPIGETCKAGKFLTVTTSRISRSLTVGFFFYLFRDPSFSCLASLAFLAPIQQRSSKQRRQRTVTTVSTFSWIHVPRVMTEPKFLRYFYFGLTIL